MTTENHILDTVTYAALRSLPNHMSVTREGETITLTSTEFGRTTESTITRAALAAGLREWAEQTIAYQHELSQEFALNIANARAVLAERWDEVMFPDDEIAVYALEAARNLVPYRQVA